MTTIAAGIGDVLWSIDFLWRHAIVLLAISTIPAVQRIIAALHPNNSIDYAWPIETLISALRIGMFILVFWVGWQEDAVDHTRPDTIGEILSAVGAYVQDDWLRIFVALFVAAIVFIVFNAIGPFIAKRCSVDKKTLHAWKFGMRNLVLIPLWCAIAYGLVRPAFL